MGIPPRKDLWLKLGLLFLSVSVGLGLCEAYFRLFAPSPLYGVQYQSPQIHFFTHDDSLGWRGRPGADGRFAWKASGGPSRPSSWASSG